MTNVLYLTYQVGKRLVAVILVLLVMQNAGASLLTAAVRKKTAYDGASVALMQEFGKARAQINSF